VNDVYIFNEFERFLRRERREENHKDALL